jgi:cell division protein FtsI (penicillin-binding protein 3)
MSAEGGINMKSRILLLFTFVLILWSIVLVRGAFIQIFPNERLENLKRRQFETSIQIRARRGAILDRNGKELAASVPSYSLFADPKLIQDPYTIAFRLAKTLHLRKQEVSRHLRLRNRRFVWLKRQMPEKQMLEIRSWNEPGLGFIEESKRIYPNGSLLAQTLGFVGADGRGLEGLELQFDKELRGGWKNVLLPRDARGRPLLLNGRLLTDVPDGQDLQLTIDAELQFILEQEIKNTLKQHEATRALGLILDPQTFEVLAMASVPTFDLNNALQVSSELKRNRLIADAFEPGSTMKAILMAAALEKKVLKPNTKFNCEGGHFKVGDKWITEADRHHSFGWLTATEILAKSSNVGATKIAFELGAENLFEALMDFGFGQKTGVEFPGESKGIVNPLPWRQHLLANISFGHGMTATPLQIASAYAAIANGGTLKTPVLVKAMIGSDGIAVPTKPATVGKNVIDSVSDSTLKLMLANATGDQSTGVNARIPGYPVAGKTGTAQKVDAIHGGYIPHTYISSFAGMVPVGDPKFVIYIAVDDPKKGYYGSEVAAPVFSRVAQFAVRRAGVTPVFISDKNVVDGPGLSKAEPKRAPLQEKVHEELLNDDLFPRLNGLTLREALLRIKDRSPNVRVKGHGWVVRTIPSAGEEWKAGRAVTLVLENPD